LAAADHLLRWDRLDRNGLIITRAVRHIAIVTCADDRWRHDPLQLRLDVVSLDIYYSGGGDIKRYRDSSVCLFVCLSHGATALGTQLP